MIFLSIRKVEGNRMKKILKVTLVALVAMLLTTGCGCDNKKTNPEEPKAENTATILDEQTVEGIKIGKLSMVFDKETGTTSCVATFENTTDTDFVARGIDGVITDKDGKSLVDENLFFYIGTLKAGESRAIASTVSSDVRAAVKVEYIVLK